VRPGVNWHRENLFIEANGMTNPDGGQDANGIMTVTEIFKLAGWVQQVK